MAPPMCVVPGCSNRKSGHRFPVAHKEMVKKWMAAIKRDKFYPTKYSRVYRDHFTDEDYEPPKESVLKTPQLRLKSVAVPSIFFWKTLSPASVLERKRRAPRKLLRRVESSCGPTDEILDADRDAPNQEIDIVSDELQGEECVDVGDIGMEVTFEEDPGEDQKEQEDSEENALPNTITMSGSSCVCRCGVFDINSFSNVQNSKKNYELKFYTGFKDYNHFMMVFNSLGHHMHNLKYHQLTSSNSKWRTLTPANEFFLTMIKLRRDMCNRELAIRFDISETSVSRIFITRTNFMYCQWKELDIWTPLKTTNENLKVRGESTKHTVIIDCTEVKIQKPKNPLAQQQTYSTYKQCNTVKTLIGISPAGTVIFVSDCYGGSISDRAIFEKCGIMNLLKPGDVVLADRGFQIQDLLASTDVTVVMPDFVKKGAGQLEPQQLIRSKRISSERIHVERVIGRGKTFKILSGIIPSNLVPLSGRIIFICFMLVNFLESIM